MLNKKTQRKPSNEEKVEETQFFAEEFQEEKIEDDGVKVNSKKWVNKQRVLVVSSRGVNHNHRHLMNNIIDLIPHSKKECKIERNVAKSELNEICLNHTCKYCIYFEEKKREFIMWIFKVGEGPCIKLQINNIHTLNEIKLLGNSLKYSRPLISFDKSFDDYAHMNVLKEIFTHVFNSPKNHPKTKPFYDHMLCFYNINNQIFFRNYQLLNDLKERFDDSDETNKLQLLEIGPRFSMNLIRIFDGVLGGKTIFYNPFYVLPLDLIKKNREKFIERQIKKEIEHEEKDKIEREFKDNKYEWLNK
jgi:ribosome biogenesis protein BRX1